MPTPAIRTTNAKRETKASLKEVERRELKWRAVMRELNDSESKRWRKIESLQKALAV